MIRFLAIVEFGKTNIDIAFKDEGLKTKLKDNGHGWFVDNWQTISTAIDVATFGSEMIINFAKKGDDLSKLLRENGNTKAADEIDDITAEAKSLANVSSLALDDVLAKFKADFPSTTWTYSKVGNSYEVFNGSGKKLGTIFENKIVAPGRKVIGETGNQILNKTPLLKNMKYEVDGFIYQTDDLGRVITTNADLDDIARVRLGNQQIKAVDVKDGVRGTDQGGHIVGSRFFGPGEQINLYPQSANLNQGAWKQMENTWAEAMTQGKDVKIRVDAVFEGTSLRPDAFEVSYCMY